MYEADSHPADAAEDGSVAILLARAGQRVVRAVEAELAPFRVTVTQYLVLAYLGPREAQTAGALARHAEMDSGGMTRLLDRMEKAGLVQRRLDEEDRRVTRLVLTRYGRELLPELEAAVERVRDTLVQGRSRAELERFIHALRLAIGQVATRKEAS